MLDKAMRARLDAPLNRAGVWLAARGASANGMTMAGLGLGVLAAVLIGLGAAGWVALLPLLAGRVADGLDGAVARATQKTDFGGYLDIACDFLVYSAVPLAFVIRDPGANGVAGAFLLATFYVNGTTFLGFAILAARRGMETRAQGEKSLYYTAGLLEGTETIAFFVVLCLWPAVFAPASWLFGALCGVTAFCRVVLAGRVFATP